MDARTSADQGVDPWSQKDDGRRVDTMSSINALLAWNAEARARRFDTGDDLDDKVDQAFDGEAVNPKGSTGDTAVAVVLGKACAAGGISVEHASRVNHVLSMIEGGTRLDVVAFTGGPGSGSEPLGAAELGYVYFRAQAEVRGVDVSHIKSMVAVGDSIQDSLKMICARSGRGGGRAHVHLISNTYHLCNLNDIHHRSPSRSVLTPMSESLGGATWTFETVVYPFLDKRRGRVFLLGQELVPILVNIRGVTERREFFQRDNYRMMGSIRRGLVAAVEDAYGGDPTNVEGDPRDQLALEDALVRLGRVVDLARPAGTLSGSVSMNDWEDARANLELAMTAIRNVSDPDDVIPWSRLPEPTRG